MGENDKARLTFWKKSNILVSAGVPLRLFTFFQYDYTLKNYGGMKQWQVKRF